MRKGERERDEVIYLENYRIRKKIREERRERQDREREFNLLRK